MEISNDMFLTSTNYFLWKSRMEDILRSKGLYRITLGMESPPTDPDKLEKWENRNDLARGLIGLSISPDLQFHLQGIHALDDAWQKLNTVFGIKNEIRTHQLENELLTLDPNTFPCMEDFITKFKTLRVLLASCKVTKGG